MYTDLAPTPLVVETASTLSDPLMWVSVLLFLTAAALETVARRRTVPTVGDTSLPVLVGAAAWVTFGVFWVTMFPYFYLEFGSPLEGLLSLAALPACVYTAYLLVTGRDSLLLLTRAVGFMGLLYIPIATIEPVRTALIETVAVQTQWGMGLVGYEPALEEGANGYVSRFVMEPYTGEGYSTYIVLACTGIGSIAIFGGLVAAVRAPLSRKVAAFVAATGVIWVLNIARNVFVGLAAPLGWFDYDVFHSLTALVVGEGMRTSFFVSHHIISQTLSVVALVGITFLVVKLLPETVAVLEEVLFVLTGDEYDLADAVGVETPDHGPSMPADD